VNYDKWIITCQQCDKVFNLEDDGTAKYFCKHCSVDPFISAYCSEECQFADQAAHSPIKCKPLLEAKKLLAVLDDLVRVFNDNTHINKCAGLSVRKSWTTLAWSFPSNCAQDNKGWTGEAFILDFQREVMPKNASETAKEIASQGSNISSVVVLHMLYDLFANGQRLPQSFIRAVAKILRS
jgi:hypothetical protein